MLEVISEMMMLWYSVILTVWLVTAFAKANIVLLEWELRMSSRRLWLKLEDGQRQGLLLIPSRRSSYRPKIPNRADHHKSDEEDPTLVVC